MTKKSGPARAPVSPLASREKRRVKKTQGTSGQPGSGSSISTDLQSFLASRLQALTASSGSILFRLTWKEQATPLGRRICVLRASARRTFAKDSTSSLSIGPWPIPCSQDGSKGGAPPQGTESGNGSATRRGPVGVVGDACGERGRRNTGAVLRTQEEGPEGRKNLGGISHQPIAPSVSGSFWGDAEWLPCKDAKLRPAESSIFPLVDGVSGRLGRLRAYGNAIVPQVAATFIRAVMDFLIQAP
jgi:hypothetical protein